MGGGHGGGADDDGANDDATDDDAPSDDDDDDDDGNGMTNSDVEPSSMLAKKSCVPSVVGEGVQVLNIDTKLGSFFSYF